MPKIIEDLPRRLMEEARRQVLESGYSSMTIRSVAKGCGVGTGTVYNYYASKDALVAAFLLVDWRDRMEKVCLCARSAEDPEYVLRSIHYNLAQFCTAYAAIFRDPAAAVGFSGSFGRYHALLRSQLAEPVRGFCPDDFTAEFIAEAMLVWTVAGKPFEEIYQPVSKLFHKER